MVIKGYIREGGVNGLRDTWKVKIIEAAPLEWDISDDEEEDINNIK